MLHPIISTVFCSLVTSYGLNWLATGLDQSCGFHFAIKCIYLNKILVQWLGQVVWRYETKVIHIWTKTYHVFCEFVGCCQQIEGGLQGQHGSKHMNVHCEHRRYKHMSIMISGRTCSTSEEPLTCCWWWIHWVLIVVCGLSEGVTTHVVFTLAGDVAELSGCWGR